MFWKHDVVPGAQFQERNRIEAPSPDSFHDAGTDLRDVVLAREAESSLDLWVEPMEVLSEGLLEDGSH